MEKFVARKQTTDDLYGGQWPPLCFDTKHIKVPTVFIFEARFVKDVRSKKIRKKYIMAT